MKPRLQAALLLVKAAALIPEDAIAPMIRHLARVLRMAQKTEDVTVVVKLPIAHAQPIRVRQDETTGDLTLIHSVTGERRYCSCEDLAENGLSAAWGASCG